MGVQVYLYRSGRRITGLADPTSGHFDAAGDFDRLIPTTDMTFPVLSDSGHSCPALRCLLMTRDDARLWTDRSCLQNLQYRTDANLAARQSIYAYQQPRLDLPPVVLGLAALRGDETVVDVGCGNGAYLAELAHHGHAGPMLGVDLSAGMLQAARSRAPGASLVAGDAAALPLRDNASGLTLAMHMLYHVPEPPAAVRELRRITQPGGQVLVMLNGEDHLRELRDLITTALRNVTSREPPLRERLRAQHVITQDLPDPGAFATAVGRLVPTDDQGVFRVRTHSGCLVCS